MHSGICPNNPKTGLKRPPSEPQQKLAQHMQRHSSVRVLNTPRPMRLLSPPSCWRALSHQINSLSTCETNPQLEAQQLSHPPLLQVLAPKIIPATHIKIIASSPSVWFIHTYFFVRPMGCSVFRTIQHSAHTPPPICTICFSAHTAPTQS